MSRTQLDLATEVLAVAREMNARGINAGMSGNVSARLDDDHMLITPSGMAYEAITPNHMVKLRLADGDWQGEWKPSSEWRFHAAIYQARSDRSAVVHVHSRAATALACLHRDIPPFHYMVAMAGGHRIPCVGYATYGTQALSDQVLSAVGNVDACLMANHGMLALGEDLSGALSLAVEVEQLAACYLDCLKVGEPVLLPAEEMDRVLQKFRGYGRHAQTAE
jgi:L-fuculose-phosphate aldolase